jgi:hypothetical protein
VLQVGICALEFFQVQPTREQIKFVWKEYMARKFLRAPSLDAALVYASFSRWLLSIAEGTVRLSLVGYY